MSVLTTRDPVLETRILPSRRLLAQLRSADGQHHIATLSVYESITIGRAPDVSVQMIEDPYVSARHAVIFWDGLLQMYVIMDTGSRNGTYVDDVQVTSPVRLVDGACIRLGMTEVVYCISRDR